MAGRRRQRQGGGPRVLGARRRRTATRPSRASGGRIPTSTLGDPDGMMWRLLGPGGPQDYWRHAQFDELGEAARFSVDEKFRGQAYKEMTQDLPRALPVDARHPALRGLRAAEVRRVDAEPEPGSSRSAASTSSSAGPRSGRAGAAAAPAAPPCAPSSRFLGTGSARALVAVWLVSTVVFVVMRLSGDPVPLLLPPDAPRSEILRVRAELGLDRPLPVQYARLPRQRPARRLRPLASTSASRPSRVVLGYLPATLELGLTAFALAVVVAVPVGLLSAVRRNSLARPGRHGRRPRRPVGADVLPGHPRSSCSSR